MELIHDFIAEFHYGYVVGLCLSLLFLYQLTRQSRILSFTIIFIVPPGLTYYWLQYGHTPFLWIKLYSIVLFMMWWYLCRLPVLRTQKWMPKLCSIILIVNILEGVLKDGLNNHWLNAGAGSLLIGTILLFGTQSLKVNPIKPHDLIWDIPLPWIIGYTIWNTVFFYNHFTDAIWLGLATLLAPLTNTLWGREEWLQARVITLYWMMIIFFTHKEIYKPLLTSLTYNAEIGQTINIISFVWMVMATVYIAYQKISRNKKTLT